MSAAPSAHAAIAQQPGSPVHVWDYWAVVMKRVVLVVLFIAVAVVSAYVITQRQQKLYRATATIEIMPPSVMRGSDAGFMPAIVSDDMYLSTKLEVLKQGETVTRAVKDQNLALQPDFQGKSETEIAQMAMGHIDCGRRRGLYLIDVSVWGPDPKALDKLANALVKTFQALQKSEAKQARDERRAYLDDKASQADSQIRLLNIDRSQALSGQNFTDATFTSAFLKIQASRQFYDDAADKLYAKLLEEEPAVAVIKQARQDPKKEIETIAQLQFVRRDLRVQEAERKIHDREDERDRFLRNEYGPQSPQVKAAIEQINDAVRDRERIIRDLSATFVKDHEDGVGNHGRLVKQVEMRTQELTAAAAVKTLVDAKTTDIERYKAIRDAAVHEREALSQAIGDEKEAVRIAAPAQPPLTPYSPNTTTNMILGLIFGVVGGVALAFLLDYLDDTIRTKDELARIAPDVPLLGVVPNIEAKKSDVAKKDLFAANQPKSTISEAYRGVRTALTLSARGPQQKVLLLTSAGPREGKTTTALNLATVLAFSGARTLIIDADLRKPRAHASFNLPNKRGLTNLIVSEDDPFEACQKTSIERVDVLTSGPIPPNPSELLGRPRMREILRKLRERYDQIVIDTPPIGAVTDAAVMATMCDGVILVVHAGKTRRQIVSRGIEQLRYINAHIVGVILNNLKLGRGRYYPGYYHYYYYYTSHYGSEDSEAKKPKSSSKKTAAPEAPAGNPSE